MWTPGIYGLGDHLFDCFCWSAGPRSILVKLVFLEGRYLDASMLLPLHRGTTPHLPIGDHDTCALRLSLLWPGLISSILKHSQAIG